MLSVTVSSSATWIKVVVLFLIALTAFGSRLFSVIRYESIIHEFDPWFNYRSTQYLVNTDFYSFMNWFDSRSWYPLGRVVGGTVYPGIMFTSATIHWILNELLHLPVIIRDVCVFLAPMFSGLTAAATYLLTCEVASESAGLLSALFIGIVPGYISRSVAGSYDNEGIAIFLLMFTFYLWVKAVKIGSSFYGVLTALFYCYMVAAWGGYVFIINLIPLHVFVLCLMGRFSEKLYISYSTFYVVGTLGSMTVPFVGFLPTRTNDHMAALGIFGLVQLLAFAQIVKSHVTSSKVLPFLVAVVFLGSFCVLVFLTVSGYIAPWTGRLYSLWDTGYAKKYIPIIASVSEHQPTTWSSMFFDLQLLYAVFPAGVYACFKVRKDEHVFLILYSLTASYFAGVMVRLILTLTPVVCICSSIAISNAISQWSVKEKPNSTISIYLIFSWLLAIFVQHSTYVTSSAYSSPSVILSSWNNGQQVIIDDFREAYYWLRKNTHEDAKVMSWWDYGYQIAGMANRTTLVDNNTWNNTHIASVGKAMSTAEPVAYEVMRRHDVDYVLIIYGGVLGYSGDDINKFLWMIRISQGEFPKDVKESAFFTPQGQYRIGEEATTTMKESLMYKMSYYRMNELYGGRGQDRVRGEQLPAATITLDYLEEAFSSENFIVRIYKVKPLDFIGRSMKASASFDRKYYE